jgi:hypothetical protein
MHDIPFFMAIVAIVAITSFAKIVRSRHMAQSRIEVSLAENADNAQTAALAREVAALNQRIAVLERIITDNRSSVNLAHEIDALRDR